MKSKNDLSAALTAYDVTEVRKHLIADAELKSSYACALAFLDIEHDHAPLEDGRMSQIMGLLFATETIPLNMAANMIYDTVSKSKMLMLAALLDGMLPYAREVLIDNMCHGKCLLKQACTVPDGVTVWRMYLTLRLVMRSDLRPYMVHATPEFVKAVYEDHLALVAKRSRGGYIGPSHEWLDLATIDLLQSAMKSLESTESADIITMICVAATAKYDIVGYFDREQLAITVSRTILDCPFAVYYDIPIDKTQPWGSAKRGTILPPKKHMYVTHLMGVYGMIIGMKHMYISSLDDVHEAMCERYKTICCNLQLQHDLPRTTKYHEDAVTQFRGADVAMIRIMATDEWQHALLACHEAVSDSDLRPDSPSYESSEAEEPAQTKMRKKCLEPGRIAYQVLTNLCAPRTLLSDPECLDILKIARAKEEAERKEQERKDDARWRAKKAAEEAAEAEKQRKRRAEAKAREDYENSPEYIAAMEKMLDF